MHSLRNVLSEPVTLASDSSVPYVSLAELLPAPLPLKQTVAAVVLLVQPGQPLPSDSVKRLQELKTRLKESKDALPSPWVENAAWVDGFELETLSGAEAVVARRAMDLMLELQRFLQLEFVSSGSGFTERDFALGTLDSKATRLALQTIAQYLLVLTTTYLQTATVPPFLSSIILGMIQLATFPVSTPPTILTQLTQPHLSTTTLCSITLGWTPSNPPHLFGYLRSRIIKLLNEAGPGQAMAILSGATRAVRTSLKAGRKFPVYVERTIGLLLSRQLVAPGGVRGLMDNVFGERTGQEAVADPAKLEHVANVLSNVPKELTPERYFGIIIPALLNAINAPPDVPPSPSMHIHAASYTISHLLSGQHVSLVVPALQKELHAPFRPAPPSLQTASSTLPSLTSLAHFNTEPTVAVSGDVVGHTLQTLQRLTLNAPPGSKIWHHLITPILPILISLSATLVSSGKGKSKAKIIVSDDEDTVDWPGLVKDLLEGWGRVGDAEEVEQALWRVLRSGRGWAGDQSVLNDEDGKEFFWAMKDGAPYIMYGEDDPMAALSQISLMPQEDDTASLLSMMPLYPNPSHFADILKAIQRPDVAGNIFLRALGEYRIRAEASGDEDLQTILFLQVVLQIVEKLGESVLGRSEQVLEFVEDTLGGAANEAKNGVEQVQRGLAGISVGGDEIEEESGLGKMGLVPTAVSLLLATLEANEDIAAKTHPILHPIEGHLRVLAEEASSSDTKKLSREALLILSARQSLSSFSSNSAKPTPISSSQETYRKALSLVQDPLLPVRAHGLIMLRDLVLSPEYDRALTPNIMDLFMHSVQDPDSYVYLNAVKGLAGMVDALGKEVLVSLVGAYRTILLKAEKRGMEQDEMEKALRIAEALSLVVRRLGEALSAYADKIVPVMLSTFPARHLPTIIRSSALSILAACAEADPQALLPWSLDLVNSVIDLVQIESVPMVAAPRPSAQITEASKSDQEDAPHAKKPAIIDEEPTNVHDSRHPVLRRGALVFLGLHVQTLLLRDRQVDTQMPVVSLNVRPVEGQSPALPPSLLQRARTILRYVKDTDVDPMTRQQAEEAEALVNQLRGGWAGVL